MTRAIKVVHSYVSRPWYPALLGTLSCADAFVLVIPNDGLLVSSTLLTPKRWLHLAFWVTIGSTFGAFLLAHLVQLHGLPWVLEHYHGIVETKMWSWSSDFFVKYGLVLVFLVAVSPVVQQPAVVLAALHGTPLINLVGVLLIGRTIKYVIMSYAASRAPEWLGKMWGLSAELKEVGIQIDQSRS